MTIPAEGSSAAWAGRPVQEARAWIRAETAWPVPCARCGRLLGERDRWVIGHRQDRQGWPELTWSRGNWQLECKPCSDSSGATQGNVRRGVSRRATKLRAVQSVSSRGIKDGPHETLIVSDLQRVEPVTLSADPRHPGDRDGLPRMFPPPHPTAVASLGDDYTAFVEGETGTRLRWWQWLTAQRRYEIDADGRWCWPRVWTSVMRQSGKSVECARDGAWHGGLGREALTLHCAQRVGTSRDVQSELWPWAYDRGLDVAKQLGDSRITWPDGSVWRTIAMESSYSQRPRRLLVDEAWALDPVGFWNALWPAMGGQDETVQALLWSCANLADKGIAADMRADDQVLRMEWGILPGEDPQDPAVWRACTAYWNSGREALMRAAAGKPGFAVQWLNEWPQPHDVGRWLPLANTAATVGRVGDGPPTALAALESTPDGTAWGVAMCWPHTKGRVRGRVWLVGSLAAALRVVGERRVWVHSAVASRPELARRAGVSVVSTTEARAATSTLRDLVLAGTLTVGGLPDDQWKAARTIPADGGDVLNASRSAGDISGVKALSWAAWAVESERGRSGLVM